MLTILLVIILVFAIVGLFYRPVGTGYYSYVPSLVLFLVVVLLLLLLLHVI